MFSAASYSFNIHALPPLITALAILLLGLIVVIREKGSRESLLYLCYTLTASTWMFCVSVALLLSLSSEETAYRWMTYANAGVTMIPAALFHFTVVVMRSDSRNRQRVRLAWAVSAVFLTVTLLTDVLFDGLYHYSWGIYLKFRWPSILFMGYFSLMTVLTLGEYWVVYRSSDRNTTRHRRAKAFLIAFSIGYLGALDFLPALGVPYYPLSSVPMICMLVLVSRAIWRHRLVDITPAFAAREIIDTMNDALIVVDPDGIVRLVNQATCVLFKCLEQDLVGKRPVSGLSKSPAFAETLESVIRSGAISSHEVEYRHQEGLLRTLSLIITTMRNPLGEPLATVCVVSDITDRKRGEEERERLIAQLRAANEKLQAIDKMKSDFISVVSHELRTPLTTIKAFVELIVMKPDMPELQKAKIMNTVNVEADRLSLLISDLLDLSRIESGEMMWRMTGVSIDEIVRKAITNMGPLLEDKGLHLTTAFNSPLAPLSGDHNRLIQVMTNILSNAVKFTPRGGAIDVAVRQETEPRAQIVVAVADTGVGIPAGDLDLIFEKFHRSGDQLIDITEGTGLGLAITRQIVEYHGGRIWAESTPGKGSVFTFTLPLGS
jgi:PAS domain S-box-containing protein